MIVVAAATTGNTLSSRLLFLLAREMLRYVPLTPEDIATFQTLIRDEVDSAFERRLSPFREEVMGHFDHLYAQNEKREQEYLVITGQLGRIDTRLTNVESRLTNVESHVKSIDARLTNVESRLTNVESDVKSIKESVSKHDRELDTLMKKSA